MARKLWSLVLQPPPARAEEPLLTRVIGVLFICGGILMLVSLLLPHPAPSNTDALWILDAIAFGSGSLMAGFAPALPRWLIQGAIGVGSALIALAVLFSGAGGLYSFMFVWVAAFSALVLSRRAALAHLAWLLACYGAALVSIEDSAGYSPLTRWLLVAFALSVVSGLTAWLVDRNRLAEQRTLRFFDLSRDMLCTATSDGYFVELNRAWTHVLGYSLSELRSRPYLELVHPDDRERTEREASGLFEGQETVKFENRYRARDGSWHWLLWSSSLSHENGLLFARATDVTESKRLEAEREELIERLDSQARTDPLTGVPNRRWLDHELAREMSRARRQGSSLAVAIIDLDHFKEFNDRYGHPAGDRLLCEAVNQWRSTLRVSDFLARYGGEEFVVLIPGSSPAEAQLLIERVRSVTPDAATCSAGIAIWDSQEDSDGLIERADAALYSAKKLGRDRTIVHVSAGTEISA